MIDKLIPGKFYCIDKAYKHTIFVYTNNVNKHKNITPNETLLFLKLEYGLNPIFLYQNITLEPAYMVTTKNINRLLTLLE